MNDLGIQCIHRMGTCEDSPPSIDLVKEINLETESNGAHHGDGDDLDGCSEQVPAQKLDDGDDDRDGSSEQALVQNLENSHLEEEKQEGEGDEVGEAEEEDKESDGDGEQGEEEQEKEQDEDEDEEVQQNDNGDHPYPLRPQAEDCAYYMRTGSCKFGSNCRFNHPLNRANQLLDVDNKDLDVQGTDDPRKIECKYYLTPEGCKYGSACRYIHSKEKTDNEPLELNFLGLPMRMGEKECPYYMHHGSCGYGSTCRFHHPDPTASIEEPKNLMANGGALQGGKIFVARDIAEFAPSMSSMPGSASNSRSENLPSYVPWMNSLPQGMPQVPGYNQYQVQVSLPDNTLNSRPSIFVTSPLKRTDSFGLNQQLTHNEEFPERPGQQECDYFMKTGTCKFRSACRYHHPRSRLPSMPNVASYNVMKEASHVAPHTQMVQIEEYPERPGQLECAYFMKTGQCKYKSTCKYHHPKNPVPKLAASMYSMNGLPSGSVPFLSHESKKVPDSYPIHLNQTAKPFKQHLQPMRVEEFPERPGQPECEYFMKTGDCKYKSACRYHHPKGSRSQVSTGSDCALNEKGLPLRPGAKTCRNYEQLGICKYGPRCLFDHPLDCDSSAVPEPTPPQSLPGNNAGSDDWGDGWVIG